MICKKATLVLFSGGCDNFVFQQVVKGQTEMPHPSLSSSRYNIANPSFDEKVMDHSPSIYFSGISTLYSALCGHGCPRMKMEIVPLQLRNTSIYVFL